MGMANKSGLGLPIGSEIVEPNESGEPQSSYHSDTLTLIIDFQDDDVLLGRGKSNATHIGNIRFQELITEYCDSYLNAPTHQAKKDICGEIIKVMRGRFLRFVTTRNAWIQISEDTARIKVAQAFQYRQRRGNQNEANLSDNSQTKPSRKRPASPVSSSLQLAGKHGTHWAMQNIELLKPADTHITNEEIRWALGMQPSLPDQRLHIVNPLFCSDNHATGLSSTMTVPQIQRPFELFTPNASLPEVTNHSPTLRYDSMLTSAAIRTESTASSLLQAQLSHQAGLFHGHLPQGLRLPQNLQQPSALMQDVYTQPNQLNTGNLNLFPYQVVNPNMRDIFAPAEPIELQGAQLPISSHGQGPLQRENEIEFRRGTMDSYTNQNPMEGYMVAQRNPAFNSLYMSSSVPSYNPERTDTLSGSFTERRPTPQQNHDHILPSNATTRLPYNNIYSAEPEELNLDPLPLDDNERLLNYDMNE